MDGIIAGAEFPLPPAKNVLQPDELSYIIEINNS
jgi:hypothetical protein